MAGPSDKDLMSLDSFYKVVVTGLISRGASEGHCNCSEVKMVTDMSSPKDSVHSSC